MPTLKQAQQDPEAMKQYIAEHEGDEIEEQDFDKVGYMMLVAFTITTHIHRDR